MACPRSPAHPTASWVSHQSPSVPSEPHCLAEKPPCLILLAPQHFPNSTPLALSPPDPDVSTMLHPVHKPSPASTCMLQPPLVILCGLFNYRFVSPQKMAMEPQEIFAEPFDHMRCWSENPKTYQKRFPATALNKRSDLEWISSIFLVSVCKGIL